MKFQRHDFHNTHPNVVPLIDIIMCLIVFFMLVARIGVSSGEDASIRLPYAAMTHEIKSMDNTLLINVREVAGQPEITSQIDGTNGRGREPLILEGGGTGRKLVDVLKNLRNGKGSGTAVRTDFKVVVRGDSQMSYGVLQQVLLAVNQAKITNLNFQTTQRPEK